MLKRFILPRLRNPKNLLTCSKVLSVDFFVQNCKSISIDHKEKKCKLLIIGGGSGGCSVAAKFTSKLGKNSVVIIEPSEVRSFSFHFFYLCVSTVVSCCDRKITVAIIIRTIITIIKLSVD